MEYELAEAQSEFAKEQGGICILTLQRPSESVLSRKTNDSPAEQDGKQAIRTEGTHTPSCSSQLKHNCGASTARNLLRDRKTGKASLSQLP
ncbi:TPA: hypothetical protein ACH3X1_011243 [Trebouxia sp. C0004]